MKAGREDDVVERQLDVRDASKSSSWKGRPSAASAKYEQVPIGSAVPGASSSAPDSAAISKRREDRSILRDRRAVDREGLAHHRSGLGERRLGRSQRVGDVVRQHLLHDVLSGRAPRPDATTPRYRSDAHGSSSKTSMTSYPPSPAVGLRITVSFAGASPTVYEACTTSFGM